MTLTILPESPPTRPKRGRPSRAVALAVAGAVLAAGAVGGFVLIQGHSSTGAPPVATAATTADLGDGLVDLPPQQILARVHQAEFGYGSVQTRVVNVFGKHRLTYSAANGDRSGLQVIKSGPVRAAVRVVGPTTYFRGNRAALRDYFGLPPAVVAHAGTWLRLRPSDSYYARVTEGVTLRSTMDVLELAAPLTVVRTGTKQGVGVIGVRGTLVAASGSTGATGTLWVRASGAPLPVEFDASAPQVGTTTVTFSLWGSPVDVAAPARSRPFPSDAVQPSLTPDDAQMRSDLRNAAVAEETYFTYAVRYATAAELSAAVPLALSGGDHITIHLAGEGYCLAAHMGSSRYWIYSSLEGGVQAASTATDTCSRDRYVRNGGVLAG
jgi:hypothetical protein